MKEYLCHIKANKHKFCLITILLLFLGHINTDLYAQTARTVLNNQSMPDKRIWLFTEPHGMPPWNQANPYGSLYMLDLQESENDPARFSMGTRLLESGITGYIIGSTPGELFNGWKSAMMSDFNLNFPAIKMTICISSGNLVDIVTSVKSYLDVAKNYSNAPMINGKYVIFTYAPQGTSLSVWNSVRSQLSSAGYNTFFFQDVNINWNNGIPNESDITSWFPAFDGSYVWTDTNYRNTDNWNNWNWFISLMNSNGNRATLGGMFPAYSRESPGGGYLEDSQGGYKGTYHLRAMLQAHLDSRLQWWHISTANDCSEESELLPSSWWSISRSDITRLYAFKLGSISSKPTNSANLYAVSPQHIHLGEALYAESLIVNWNIQTVNSKLELYDGDYNLVTSSEMKPVPAESTGVAVFANFYVNSLPAKRFFRVKALLFDANGIEIKSVWGAPICVYETNQSIALRNTNYYVIPANKALPGVISVSMNGDPSKGNAIITVTPPVGTVVRFAEALQNTKLVYNGSKGQFIQKLSNPYLVSLPTASYTTSGGEIVNPETTGFYMARIIDSQERVGYSDPVLVNLPIPQAPYRGSARTIPGTIQAEDFDTGGEGIAYHDLDIGNTGGAYRTGEDVDISSTTDTGGGYNVGWSNSGEWLEYTTNVTAGNYDITLRVATVTTTAQLKILIDGTQIGSTISLPNTGNWNAYQDIVIPYMNITGGTNRILRLEFTGGLNLNWIKFTTASQSPYGGSIRTIPCIIQAEDFDNGGEGIAYHDADAGNTGSQYRTTENVDISTTTDTGGGYNVGWTSSGEWLEYTINAIAGNYNIVFRVASMYTTGQVKVYLDGTQLGSIISIPNTGSWDTYQDISLTNINLGSGNNKVLRIEFASGLINLNKFTFVDAQAPTAPSGLSSSNVALTSYTLSWIGSTDNVGVTGYDVYKNGIYLGTTSSLSMIITGLSRNTSYSMTVKAKDAAGNISVASAPFVQSTLKDATIDVTDVEVIENKIMDFLIFPNPSSDGVVKIELSGFDFKNECIIHISIFDIMGKLIYKKQQNSSENISLLKAFPKGIYFVKAEYSGHLFSKKLVIN